STGPREQPGRGRLGVGQWGEYVEPVRRPDKGLAASAVRDMGLRHFERGAGQAAIDPGSHRLGVETELRYAAISRLFQRLLEQPLDRLVPFTRTFHGAFLSPRLRTIQRGFLASRVPRPGPDIEQLAQIQRTRVLGDAFETPRDLRVGQPDLYTEVPLQRGPDRR